MRHVRSLPAAGRLSGLLAAALLGMLLGMLLGGCCEMSKPVPSSQRRRPKPAPSAPAAATAPPASPTKPAAVSPSPSSAEAELAKLAALLPTALPGRGPLYPVPQTYTARTLFQAVDGADADYEAYSFVRGARQRYRKPGENQYITLDLFELADAASAYGLLTFKMQGLPPEAEVRGLGDIARRDEEQLCFAWDRFYVQAQRDGKRVTAAELYAAAEATLARLAAGAKRSGEFKEPELVSRFRKKSRLPFALVYFTSSYVVKELLGEEDALGIGEHAGVAGLQARYRGGQDDPFGKKLDLLFLSYPDEAKATAGLEGFRRSAREANWPVTTVEGFDFFRDEEGSFWGILRRERELRLYRGERAGPEVAKQLLRDESAGAASPPAAPPASATTKPATAKPTATVKPQATVKPTGAVPPATP